MIAFLFVPVIIFASWFWVCQKNKKVVSSNPEEQQYLDLIRDILDNGVERPDRTGVGTLSVFGRTMRFELRNNSFPLLTTKKVFWKGIANELFWFISGSTNNEDLLKKGTKIWTANLSREALDKYGFEDREVNDLGPGYPFQWRHSGAVYNGMRKDYTGQGIDQLANVIKQLKEDPNSRRMIVCSFIPKDVPIMSLAPCHCLYQFYVSDGELSCCMYQRSTDVGCGLPFNIASYALLTRLIAQVCGLKAKEFVWFGADVHIYLNHVDALTKQLERDPYIFPTLEINPTVMDIDKFTVDDLFINNYQHHRKINLKMAV
jgi:thymidylate synthase